MVKHFVQFVLKYADKHAMFTQPCEWLSNPLVVYVSNLIDKETREGPKLPSFGCVLIIDKGHEMDINVRAFRVVQQATDENLSTSTPKQAAARKGGLVGGHARAQSISSERRIEIAKKANRARWKKSSSE